MDDDIHVGPIVIRGRLTQNLAARMQLVQDLFEPKFVSLVDDDEQHLIVRLNFPVPQAKRVL
jgi:hypothetical protein